MNRIDIRISKDELGHYRAVDDLTYDVDCDENGYYPTTPIGWGYTPLQAAIDLLEQMEG